MHSIRRLPLLILILVLVLLFLLALPALATSGPTPAEVVATAWQNTQTANAYTYSATAIQTDHPLPKLQNIGLSPHTQHLFAQGTMSQAEQGLTLNLWQEGSQLGDLNSALQVKIENGQVYGRVGTAEWQPLEEDVAAVFAPGQDMMGYLAAATNVTFLGQETRADLTFSRYTFTLDGTLLATQLRDQFQEEFARRGELPAGIQFQLPRRYVEMIGSGELWLNQDGLPLRQIISMQFPPEGDFRREVEVTTDFTNWQTGSTSLPFAAPFLNRLSDPETVSQLQTTAILTTLLLGVSWFGVTYYRRRWFYRGFVSTIVAIMLLSPLLQTRQVNALTTALATDTAAPTVYVPPAQPFNPHQNPRLNLSANLSLTPARNNFSENSTDNDGDGLSDKQEGLLGSDAYNPDTDGDGLGDGIEFTQLGTSAVSPDSDDDHILDLIEVNGYQDAGGVWWYLDPLTPDSNGDGVMDTLECPALVNPASGTACLDTDGDGSPDFNDHDNDDDGVPDRDDLAANVAMGSGRDTNGLIQGFTDQTFALSVSQMNPGVPHQVTFQFRPTNPSHLWYNMSVLDWPSNDYYGNVQRHGDTTFQDVQPQAQSTDANGDLRLIPMLEIEIPYQAGNYGGLPTIANPAPITVTNPITSWLDMRQAQEYGLGVSYKSVNSANLLVYIPVTLDKNDDTGDPTAFVAQMPYWPTQAAFSQPHQVRLIWIVQAITNQCAAFALTDGQVTGCQTWSPDAVTNIHTYVDDWYLTGLTVREDMGVDISIIHEEQPAAQPGYDADSYYERGLWSLFSGLESSFLAGRVDGGQTFDLGEISRRFDVTRTATLTESWGITTTFNVHAFSLEQELHLAYVPMTYTQQVLNANFGDAAANTQITLLYASEQRERTATLTAGPAVITAPAAENGVIDSPSLSVALDPDAVPSRTIVNLRWAPFRALGANEWAAQPPADYLEYVRGRIAHNPAEYNFIENISVITGDDYVTATGFDVLESFYVARYLGMNSLVELNELPTPAPNAAADALISNNLAPDLGDTFGGVAAAIKDMVDLFADAQEKGTSIISLNKGFDAAGVGFASAGAVFGVLALVAGDSPIGQALTIAKDLMTLLDFGRTIMQAVKNVQAWGDTVVVGGGTAVIVLIVVVLIIIITFVIQIWASDIEVGSVAFNQALIKVIATTIVIAIYILVSMLPFGAIIITIIGAIDGLLSLICNAVEFLGDTEITDEESGWTYWVCGGITGALVELIAYLFYDSAPLLDMSRADRLQYTPPQPTLVDPSLGYSGANQIQAGLVVTSSLYPNADADLNLTGTADEFIDDENLIRTTLRYTLTLSEELGDDRFHVRAGIETDQMMDEWLPTGAVTPTHYVTDALSITIPLSLIVGINQPLPLYLAEGQGINTVECVPVTFGLGCWLNGESDTLYINLGERYPFDIFPATLDEFVSLTRIDGYANGYAPLWSQTGSPAWPVQADADGDGLRSPDHPTMPGNDPNDSTADADNDGLSDFFEIKYNSNPLQPDSDNDGLFDADEVFYHTNPNLADSDQDGLSDGAEITGWAFIYYYDASTRTTHTTWVVSDPLTYDTDGDELSDQQEKLYGFNPRVYSAEAVLSISTALDDSDGFVAPGQVISYTAIISNETTSRQANGLLTVEFPPAVQDSTLDPKPFILEAGESTVINGTVMVNPIAPSQQITLTNRAGAVLIPQISPQSLWLQFNEEVNTGSYYDDARPQHSLTCTTCPAPTTGYQANALNFNGVDDNLTVGQPDRLGLSGPSFTFMAWVRFPNITPLSPLFIAGQQSGSTWSDYLEFRLAHGLPEFAGEVGGNPIQVSPNPTPVPANVWYHLAWRYDGLSQQLTLFRDGVALTSETVTALPATITSAFIGQGFVGHFNGQIDNLEIYPTALTDAAIAAMVLKPAIHLNFENVSATTDLYGNLAVARNATTNSPDPYAQTGGVGGGHAAAFDGQHNVVLPNTPSTRYSAYTHSFWVFPQNTNGLQGIAGSGQATAINDLNAAGFGLDATASIFIENGTRLVVGFGDGTQFRTATSGNILTPNQWNHVVLSYGEDGVAQYQVYVNGIFRETLVGTFAAATQNPQMPGFIGSATQHGIVTYHGMYVYYDLVDGDGDMELYFLFNGNRVNRQDFIADGDQWFPANGVNPVENSNPVQFYQYQGLLTGYEDDNEDWDDPLDPAADDRLNYDFWALEPSQYLFNIALPTQNNATIYTNQNINNLLAEFIFGDPVLFDLGNDDPGVANLVVSHANPSQPFTGYLDEFREYHRALTASEAQLLYRQSQPNSVAFNLDEPPGASTFADFAGSYLQGACNFLGDTCPITGIPGLSNQMALFGSLPDGDSNANDYLTLPAEAAPFTDSSFTLSVWANPRELAGATRPIIGTDDERAVSLALVNGFPTFTFDNGTPYGHTLTAPAPLNENEWVHLAAVYHAGSPAGDSRNWATTASGASVSLIDGSGAANVIDSSISTGATTTSTANAWVRIDLGQVRQVNQITVRTLGDNAPPAGTVRLFYDNNFAGGAVWQMGVAFSSYQSFTVNEQFARYVEIKLNGSASDPLTVYKIEVFGATDQPRRELYVDGTLVASQAGPAPVRTYNNIFIGRGRSPGSYDYYRGYLDQVQFHNYGVKNINNLLRDVPVFRLRLDEQSQPTTNQFSNSVAGLPHAASDTVSCLTTAWCPVAGPPGKMNRSAVFTASRLDTTLAQTVGGEFTVSFWIKGAQGGYPSGDLLYLRTTTTAYAQVGFDSNGLPTFTVNNGNALTYLSPLPLEPNQWYHVVFRRSAANGERAIFVNGQKIATGSAGTRPSGNLIAYVGAFSGNELYAQLDELNIHNLALTDGQISRLYDYQASWYEIAYDNRIVVDGETPNLYLTTDLPDYLRRQDAPLFLAITADDLGPTGDSPFASGVISMTYQVNGGVWQTAVPDGALWLLTVTPDTAGPLNLTVRATDQSENNHTASRTLTVDGAPPAAAFAQPYTSNIITTQTSGDQVTVWLQGTASDNGSGLANITLSLSDSLGRDVSGAQAAQVTGSNWGVAYPLLDSLSTGTYTATLIARDFVGNTITQTTHIRVDDSLAQAWLANVDAGQTYQPDEYLRQITYTAGTAITLTGTVLDIPYPSNSDLYLAFEEPTFDGWVMDASRSHNWLACTTCPTPAAGALGQGSAFTASATLSVPQTPVTLTQFTLAFWLNTVGAAASQQTLLDYGPHLQVERLAGSHQLAFTTGSQTLTLTNTTTLADNTWNHVAFVYDGFNQLIYVNGELLAFAPLTGIVALGDTLTVGGNFTGQIDELLLYRQAWPSTLISQLQTPIGREVQQVEAALVLREFNAPPPTSFAWQPTTLTSQPDDPFAVWSYTFPTYPLPGYYQLYLRTTDSSGRELILPRVWEGAFDCAGRIRYVNPDASGTGTGLSWDNGFTTLQDALAIPLCPHAEIWVKAGTYYPDEGAGQTANDRNATFRLRHMVTVYGGFNGTETSLDQRDWQNNITILSGDLDQNDGTGSPVGNNAFNVVTDSGVNTTAGLDGFTITGGLANQPGTFNKQNGAGILNYGASLTLQNLLITHNEALGSPGNGQPGNGGGLYNINSSSVISNVVISHNQSSRYGGGIYNEGSDLILIAVTFSNNTAVWDGGGLYNQDGAPVLQNVLFSQNQGRSGAGMFSLNGDASLTDVTFQGNNASSRGGGMTNALGSDSLLLNVLFTGNEADFFGGAMFNDGSNPTLTQVTISGNWATTCPTPTFCGGGLFNLNSSPQIRNSLIANNRERGNTGTAEANLYNYAISGGSSIPVIQSSLVQGSGGSGAGWNGSVGTDGGRNLDGDPAFFAPVDPATAPALGGDFRLLGTSVAIDAGNNALCPVADGRGETRTDWGCDLGAYEMQFTDLTTVTRPLQTGQTVTFGPTLGRVIVNDDGGCLTGLSLQRVDANHPQALSVAMQTGRYWVLTPVGCDNGFAVELSFLTPLTAANNQVCRWNVNLSRWECGLPSQHRFEAGPLGGQALSRTSVDHFSDWTIGVAAELVAVGDSFTTHEDSPFTTGNVLGNDTINSGDPLTIQSVNLSGTIGLVSHNGDGTFDYDPNGQFETLAVGDAAADTFSYVVAGGGNTATAVVTITVNGVNDVPVALADAAATLEDTAYTLAVLGNDSDIDNGDSLSLLPVSQPAHGAAAILTSTIRYTPTLNFNGTDSFTYTVSDGHGGVATAAITMTVTAVNDPPVALADTRTTAEDIPLTINPLVNDSDVDHDLLSLTDVGAAANGSTTISGTLILYTPTLNFHGTDVLTYTISDGQYSDTATITMTITAVNDAPLALADAATLAEDSSTAVNVLSNDSDVDNDPLSVVAVGATAHGAAILNGSSILYTPTLNFNGTDVLTYTISDGDLTATTTLSVTVNPVNDAPIAGADAAATDEDTAFTTPNLLLNDSDIDGDPLVVTGITLTGTMGLVINNGDGTFAYNPNGQFEWLAVGESASDSFGYTLSDGQGGAAAATVTLTIHGVNDTPIAQADTANTPEDTARSIPVLGNDSDPDLSDGLTLVGVANPAHGTASLSGTLVFYTPTLNFNGPDVFTYTVGDGHGGTTIATITVNVGAVNDPPSAHNDLTGTDEDTPFTFDPRSNDTDPDGDTLGLVAVGAAAHGSTGLIGNQIIYTPTLNFNGTDVLTYTVSDGQYPATATITITVQAINDAPVAVADAATIDEDSVLTDLNVLANDLDVDGDLLTVIAVDSTNTVGVVIYQDNGLFSYDTHNQFDWLSPGESASDSFTYTLADTQGVTATAVVTLTITGVNDVPVAVDDAAATEATSPVTITVLLNDSDADGDILTITSVTAPTQGTITVVGDEIVYTAGSNFTGEVSFTYTVSDGQGGSDTAVVIVQVTAHTYQLFMPLLFSSPAATPTAPEQGKDVGQPIRGRLNHQGVITPNTKVGLLSFPRNHSLPSPELVEGESVSTGSTYAGRERLRSQEELR